MASHDTTAAATIPDQGQRTAFSTDGKRLLQFHKSSNADRWNTQ